MYDRFSIDTLRYVRAVMNELSFSGAARALKVSQPALSTAVARLEHQLGQRIFDRSPRGVTATEFGDEIRPMVDAALDAVDGISSRARQRQETERGTLRLGVSPLIDTSLVAGVHHELMRRSSGGHSPVLSEGNLDSLMTDLKNGELDLLLVPSVRPSPGLSHRIVGSEPVVVVEQNPRVDAPVELAELVEQQLILVPDACGLTTFTRDLFAEQGLALKQYPGEAATYRVLEEWAELGLGISVLPRSKLRTPNAPCRPLYDGASEVEIFYEMVWNPASPMSEEFRLIAEAMLQAAPDQRQVPKQGSAAQR